MRLLTPSIHPSLLLFLPVVVVVGEGKNLAKKKKPDSIVISRQKTRQRERSLDDGHKKEFKERAR